MAFQTTHTGLIDLRARIDKLWGYLDLEAKTEELYVLEKDSNDPNLWNDQEKAQSMMKKIGNLRELLNKWNEVSTACNDLAELYEMSKDEESEDLTKSIESDIADLKAKIEEMEFKKMLNGPDDACACLLSIHPGAGGTESQDWALMLFRMYTHFFEREKMDFKVVDFQEAEDAGLKSATIEVTCENAYGLLRSEIGVHRLVRISPFDANARRHTSFTAVYLYPEHEDVEFDLDMADVRVDTYRSSGAGGQYINKTDSAVRMTHLPTGIMASCQTERSQIQNRETCYKMLKTMVAEHYRLEEEAKRDARMAEKKKVEWGSQIRSYVLQPYQMVKDLRTGVETSDTAGVLDGKIKPFINAYLLSTSETQNS
ncbi:MULTISPECIES: peptide chain release factor 2 [unclassified Fibrobacter]|uniref:peptide chain release factor 2 n=1 Tax=unclassified Fibrobacter TaxID=2634177 RepID=UPI000D6C3232|nr:MULTISPECIES: peptide chain release factor 2 [unclassified Fibrobacter]